ncbi:Transposon Ty3-G Gag-Pol polyprotein [Stylophora pistillata]|uniref:Transposon Ty3-G Gag-Pol polyprotein n=1 Tax=Stylophora pistillata TaxID=50429 RepID=A0A2B4SCE5_STYPI|nr:Transposon Ty3-G Gag-Pol polyprotein [Stylophora pistillata]
MMDTESLQIEIQGALCSLSEERLKEVCSGLNITVPPESKGRNLRNRKQLEMVAMIEHDVSLPPDAKAAARTDKTCGTEVRGKMPHSGKGSGGAMGYRFPGKELNLEAMNGTNILFDGWIEVEFKLAGDVTTANEVTVPVLVGQKEQEYPIIGFNVIEEVLTQHGGNRQEASNIIQQSFPSIHHTLVSTLINLIQSRTQDVATAAVKVRKRDVMLPKGEATTVKCQTHLGPVPEGMPVIFEPKEDSELPDGVELGEELTKITPGTSSHVTILVHNNTDRNILLKRRTELGWVHTVKSVLPIRNTLDQKYSRRVEEPYFKATLNPSHEQDGWELPVDFSQLEDYEQLIVREMLRQEAGAFARNDDDVGCVENLVLDIQLKDNEPVQKNYISIPKPLYGEVKEYLEDLINRNWICKSRSAYSSPMVCVRKRDGSLRLCIHYRELNKKTYPERQPIPRIQDILNGLGGNKKFTVLDQGKAFHQGFMTEESSHLTAFVTPWGLYQWNRIPIGLINAAAAFQRYLGDGYSLDPEYTAHVHNLAKQKPATVSDMRKLLGFLSYYRQYIQDFSRIAKPLYDLMAGPDLLPSNHKVTWTEEHQMRLDMLVDLLTSPPVMAFPDFTKPLVLHTDASQEGLRALLYQEQDGRLRVLGYASRTLTPSEKNYHMHAGKLESLALKWATTPTTNSRETEFGEEKDDFGSVDLVDEIPTEVRTSNSVSPGQDLPSESVEDYATTEGTNGPSGEMQVANEGSAGNDRSEGEDIAEQDMWTRPQRQRRPPQILTYNPLGNPQYQSAEPVVSSSRVNSIQAPAMTAIHPGTPLYFWVWPYCFQPAYYSRA